MTVQSQIGHEASQIVKDFVDSSQWMVGTRLHHGDKGYHVRTAGPRFTDQIDGGEIWTEPVEKSFPEGIGLAFVGANEGRIIETSKGSNGPKTIAPPVDRFGGLPSALAVMGAMSRTAHGISIRSDWSFTTNSDVDSQYRSFRQLLSPNPNGDLELVDFGMVPAVVRPKGHKLTYKALDERISEHPYAAHQKRGPDKVIQTVVEERKKRLFGKDRVELRTVEEKTATYINISAGVQRFVQQEAVIDPGDTPLVIGGMRYVLSRMYYPENHNMAVTPENIAQQIAELMRNRDAADPAMVAGSILHALSLRHGNIANSRGLTSAATTFMASWE